MARKSFQDDFQKTALRVPRDLHSQILDAAKASGRSMNAEIIRRLEKSFEPPETYLDLPESIEGLPGTERLEGIVARANFRSDQLRRDMKQFIEEIDRIAKLTYEQIEKAPDAADDGSK